MTQNPANCEIEVHLRPDFQLSSTFNDILHRLFNSQHVHCRINHLMECSDQRCTLAASCRTRQDHHALWLGDCLIKELSRRSLKSESLQVCNHLPVIQHSDDNAFELVFELNADNRHNGNTEPNHMVIDHALNKPVL